MDLKKMIEDMIETRVNKAIAEIVGEVIGEKAAEAEIDRKVEVANAARRDTGATVPVLKLRDILAGLQDEPTETTTRRQPRKRGRGRPKVRYVVATRKDPKAVAKLLPEGNVRIVWTALVKADQPIANVDLEKATGLGNKAVQSAVWFLRHNGAIKSVAAKETK